MVFAESESEGIVDSISNSSHSRTPGSGSVSLTEGMGPKMQNMESLSQTQTQSPPRRETVAVIGSGMAGLVTAHLLVCDNKKEKNEKDEGRGRFDVEVLEMVCFFFFLFFLFFFW